MVESPISNLLTSYKTKENLMNEQKPSKRNLETLSIFVVALLVGGIGFATNNNGFALAGAIFLLVSIVMGINRKR